MVCVREAAWPKAWSAGRGGSWDVLLGGARAAGAEVSRESVKDADTRCRVRAPGSVGK